MFPTMDFGKIMSCGPFEEVIQYLQLSVTKDKDQQILDFIDAVNTQIQSSLSTGSYLRCWIPIQGSCVQNHWVAPRSSQPFILPRLIK